MKITLNGKETIFPDEKAPQTLSELLDAFDIDQATVVAEVNGEIVERKYFDTKKLADSQEIELIRFVVGG